MWNSWDFSNEGRKPKVEKKDKPYEDGLQNEIFWTSQIEKRAFNTKEKDWAADGDDSDDETEYVNLALLANSNE